jgi:uncharacterized protein (TIGR03435 family)
MRRRLAFLLLCAATRPGAMWAQSSTTFDAASIKPNTAAQGIVVNTFLSGGRYVATRATLRRILGVAYQPLLASQIVGGPDWINSAAFDIAAKAQGNPSSQTLRMMLRALLSDRFQLRTHMEARETDVYALVPAKSDGAHGPQFQPATIDCSSRRDDAPPLNEVPPARPSAECGFLTSSRVVRKDDGTNAATLLIAAKGVTTTELAAYLSTLAPVGRIVVDQTAWSGAYDVNLTFEGGGGSMQNASAIFTALPEQLGLRLQPVRRPVDVLVIDHVERPTED